MLAVLSEIVVRLESIFAAKPSRKADSSLFQRTAIYTLYKGRSRGRLATRRHPGVHNERHQ